MGVLENYENKLQAYKLFFLSAEMDRKVFSGLIFKVSASPELFYRQRKV